MKPFTQTITGVLERSPNAITYALSRDAARHFDGWAVFETTDSDFDPVTYSEDNQCALFVDHDTHAELKLVWSDKQVKEEPVAGLFDVLWLGHRLRLVRVHIETECSTRWIIAAESANVARGFFEAVCVWNEDDRGDILVFRNGFWRRDKKLADQIAGASLDGLVAAPGFVESIRQETIGFFSCEEVYKRHAVAWKRGVLLLGPPGNGKTHAIKGVVREAAKPCLYVRHLEAERGTLHRSIESVFARARHMAPCILIFEDLDSMVTPKTRSAFLNELDGFASNNGVLVLATANFPEKLDPAILERPSRFDRKITFELPALQERLTFLRLEASKWKESERPNDTDLQRISEVTEGFSFAYLKELCLSAVFEWLRTGSSLGSCLDQQVQALRKQMKSEPSVTPPSKGDEDDD